MNSNSNWLDQLTRSTDRFATTLTNALAALGPWLTPLPSSALVSRATIHYLNWEPWLGLVSGAAIEILGITAISTTLLLWDYNQSRRKTQPPAPVRLAAVLVVGYAVVTILLTVLMEIMPGMVILAPALWPLLSLVGAVNLALRSQHRHRLAAADAERAERRTRRQALRQLKNESIAHQLAAETSDHESRTPNQDLLQAGRRAKREAKMNTLLRALRNEPACGITELGRRIGVSRQTVYTYLEELENAGRIRRNGHGIEVIPGQAKADEQKSLRG
jgi:hypothetical protein